MNESLQSKENLKRYVDVFADYVQKHSTTSKEDLNAIDVEKENIMRAISYANKLKDWEPIIKITQNIGRLPDSYLAHKGLPSEALFFYENAFKASKELKRKPEEGAFQLCTAVILKSWGKYEEAYKNLQSSLNTFTSLKGKENYQEYTDVLHEAGMVALDMGELDISEEIHLQNLKIRENIKYERGIAYSTHELGRILRLKSDFQKARTYYQHSLEIRKTFLDDPPSPSPTLHEMGLNELDEGILIQKSSKSENAILCFENSRKFFDESYRIKVDYQMVIPTSNTLAEIGRLEFYLGRFKESMENYQKSLQIKSMKDPSGNAYVLTLWAELELGLFDQSANQNKLKNAKTHLKRAEDLCNLSFNIRKQLDDEIGTNSVNYVFAQLQWKKGKKQDALSLLSRVYKYWKKKKYNSWASLAKFKIREIKESEEINTV
jgi:tetratricopeptide (TPR) repeat protein